MSAIVELRELVFAWPKSAPLLDIEHFTLTRGERLFLKGPSGSGKSTLLGLIAGVLELQTGTIEVAGQNMRSLSLNQRDKLRADRMGVIFQMFNLVPYLSVLQNVALPCRFSKVRRDRVQAMGGVEAEAQRLLSRLGLVSEDLLSRKVTDLSVGQQQRVAAARALMGAPDLIIADEPTSSVDADNRDKFIALLSEVASASEAAMLFVSHDGSLASQFDRAVDLSSINRAAQREDA